jgi:ribulose-5-phosphate 4-epimerase/fuculose-1-phosphate aldolase
MEDGAQMTDEAALRDEIVRLARRMSATGLVSGTSGNISARLGDDRILVTPSGVDYDAMAPGDLVAVDADGSVVSGEMRPSVDTANHLAIYRARAGVRGVVHTHSPYATAFAIVRRAIPALHIESAGALGGGVRVMDYLPPATPEAAPRLAAALADDLAILLPNHGVVAVGESPTLAFRAAQTVEDSARLAWLARALGEPHPLNEAEIDRLGVFIRDRYGQARPR